MKKRNITFYLLTLCGTLLLIGIVLNLWADKIKTSETGALLFVGSSLTLLTSLIKKKFIKLDKF
ncbi:MAG: hypothetical protein HZA13_01365 [Nitrospirae bacterium]|nr:hypothetical protein [Nitrospirota bacterium]